MTSDPAGRGVPETERARAYSLSTESGKEGVKILPPVPPGNVFAEIGGTCCRGETEVSSLNACNRIAVIRSRSKSGPDSSCLAPIRMREKGWRPAERAAGVKFREKSMDVFDYAIRMEQDGENWYRRIAERSTSEGLKKIFFLLAVEEIKHCKAVEQLKRQLGNMYLEPTGILGEVKSVFREMGKMDGEQNLDSTDGLDGFVGMRDYEMHCRNFYLEKAGQLDGMSQRIFLQLADEEDKHLRIMDQIIEFVSQEEPRKWLDQSKWSDPDDGGGIGTEK